MAADPIWNMDTTQAAKKLATEGQPRLAETKVATINAEAPKAAPRSSGSKQKPSDAPGHITRGHVRHSGT